MPIMTRSSLNTHTSAATAALTLPKPRLRNSPAMTITCNHPASSYGQPVILSDGGEVMDYGPGLTAVLERIGWSRKDLAERCGYKNVRSVYNFWQGVIPPATTLNVLGVELERVQNK